MNQPELEPRVNTLESLMADLIATVDDTSHHVAQPSVEMAEFKDEIGEFKDEMRVFKDESEQWRSKSDAAPEAFRKDMREETRKLNKQLGEIANKQGRMVEDIVEPSMDRIIKELLGLSPDASLRVECE